MRSEPGVADAAGYRLITDVRSRAGGKAVDVVFSQPYPAWKTLFSDLLPAAILKDAPGSWTGATSDGLPASGGPFRISSVDRARGEIVLDRNDLYWDTPTVLDQLVLRRMDGPVLAAGLASGEVDVALPESTPAIRTVLQGLQPAPRLQPAPEPVVTQLGMRGDSGPLSDPRARRGIAFLVDRDALRNAVAPEALPADSFGLAPSEPGYASTAPPDAPLRPDPVAAAQLLAAAGWKRDVSTGRWDLAGEPVQLVLAAAAERPEDVRVAQVIAAQLNAAGIDVTVIAPPGVQLFGQSEVPAVTPTPTRHTPTPESATATPTQQRPVPRAARLTPSTTPAAADYAGNTTGVVRRDLVAHLDTVADARGRERRGGHDHPPAHGRRRSGHRTGVGLRLPEPHRARARSAPFTDGFLLPGAPAVVRRAGVGRPAAHHRGGCGTSSVGTVACSSALPARESGRQHACGRHGYGRHSGAAVHWSVDGGPALASHERVT